MLCGVYVAKEVDAVENKGSGNTTLVDLQTLLEAFLNVSLRSACFSDEVFFMVKDNKTFSFGTTLRVIRISKLLCSELNFTVFVIEENDFLFGSGLGGKSQTFRYL